MNYQNILVSLKDELLTVTINRAVKLNALNKATLEEIGYAIKNANGDNNVKGIIITGDGPKAFAAGADIAEFTSYTSEEGRQLSANGHHVFNLIEHCTKPVVAAVNGFALGGGCELAMACHLRIASDNAKFGQPEVNLGLIPGYAGTQRLVQLIGKSKAMELLMTGDMIGAQDALHLKLVNHVTTPENLLPKCREILKKITSKAPLAIKSIVACVNAFYSSQANGFETEIDEFTKCFGTEDFKEGTSAFLEKRTPNFKGN